MKIQWLALFAALAITPSARAQVRPYIGFVYPAGGQQGTTFQIRLGGQGMDGVNSVLITGSGVTAKVTEYYWRLNNQELQLLNQQLSILRRETLSDSAKALLEGSEKSAQISTTANISAESRKETARNLIDKIERRTLEHVPTPACASIASLVFVEVAVAPDAEPGEREIRLVTLRGVSNPLPFHVGQAQEFTRKPMMTAMQQVLGKEAQALRRRPTGNVEDRVTLPCCVNGQIASGEVNRYRFEARQGQRLVISALARRLIPYIADAVPGWFQPVLVLYDAQGKEVAFDDDYRFKPDPVILYEVPQDGEYVLAIYDSLYRGREDFVYRIAIGEPPFVTSLFPLGTQVGSLAAPKMKGWNLDNAELVTERPSAGVNAGSESHRPARSDAFTGIQTFVVNRNGLLSAPVPFTFDALPDSFEKEPNNTQAGAQMVTPSVVVNGRIDKPDDWDVFQFAGKSNETVALEVLARRLDSPLDSVIKLTDATGALLAFNDDREDLGAGVNTHHADSWLMAKLPADGAYFVHIGDTGRKGGEDYGYRLRISEPQPDFALRVVPSSISLRSRSTAALSVYVIRKDGFAGPIELTLKDPPPGFSAPAVTLTGTQVVARLTIKTDLGATKEPLTLSIAGTAKIAEKEIVREAVPAEDRMQAFLWRHLVPATDLKVLVFDPSNPPPPKRVAPVRPPPPVTTNLISATIATVSTNGASATNAVAGTNATIAAVVPKPTFTRQQIAGRLRQLKLLYEEGLLTDDFYAEKVAECDAGQ